MIACLFTNLCSDFPLSLHVAQLIPLVVGVPLRVSWCSSCTVSFLHGARVYFRVCPTCVTMDLSTHRCHGNCGATALLSSSPFNRTFLSLMSISCVCVLSREAFCLALHLRRDPFFVGLFWFFSPLLNNRLPLHVYLLCFPYIYSFISFDALEYV